jgi:polar amino acid transport system ATP-binding protein
VIEIMDLHKAFGSLKVLKGVSLRVEKGSVVALIGPSGSGKSTLLRCLNLLEQPDCGTVRMGDVEFRYGTTWRRPGDRELAQFRARTGMVFQHFNLFPHMTALGNVIEGPITVRRMPRPQAVELAERLLGQVGLGDRGGEYPNRLSGGQKQRVAIARALAMEPEILLLDEVTSALDPELVGEVLDVIHSLAKGGMTMALVTHEMSFAREVADHVYFMSEGAIVEHGDPETVLLRPSNPRTQAFLSRFRLQLPAGPGGTT